MNFGSAVWQKSSFSDHNGSCVEVALTGTAVAIRDSKNSGSGQLAVAPAGWTALVSTLRGGHLNCCHEN